MKIQRLKLVNFIGIKHGLDADEVEIDFTKTNNSIIMLLGGNGAGKSVIMSMLHPFKESFDDRKDLILEGKVGEKEIDILHNGHLYEIKHTYTKSAQSFIKKDGVELNENGGVRTFEDKVFSELGLTKDYFRIGKIGSNTKNFVDFTTSDRKTYIGTFLNIEDMNEKYTVANEALKVLKKSMASIGNDLKKFQSKDIVEATITQITEASSATEQQLFELYGEKGRIASEIKHIDDELDGISIEDIQKRVNEKKNDIDSNKKLREEILEELPSVESISEDISKEISELQTSVHVKNSELQGKNLLLTDFKNKIASTNIEIESLGNPEDIKKTESEINDVKEKMKVIGDSIKENLYGQLVNKMIKASKPINKYIEKTSSFLDFVEKYFTDLRGNSLQPNRMNVEMFFDNDFELTFKKMAESNKKLITSKKEMLSKLQQSRGVKESYICQLKNLEQRPTECNIDTCPFIKDAYEHRNVVSEITEVDLEIASLKADIEKITIKQENLQECQSLYMNFKHYYDDLNVRDNDIIVEFFTKKPLHEWVSGSLSDFQNFKQSLIDGVKDVVINYSEYTNLRRQLGSLESTKKLLEDSDSSLREKYENDIKEYTKRKDNLELEITNMKAEIARINTLLSEKQRIFKLHESFVQANSKLASATTMFSSESIRLKKLSDATTKRSELCAQLNDVVSKISANEIVKRDKQASLDAAKASLAQIVALSEKKATLDKEYEPISAIVEALSPTSGIPLILMKMYLEETETITNELLDIAFGGDFKIKFVTTEKEFAIQVQSKGNIKSDIKMASQGEIAITTISISLALIEQSIGGYNILCLDEIDGHLDASNRGNFIDILNSQINKLGIEQVFVISHNDAFDTAPVGMVLLRGNTVNKDNQTFMQNKDIIFDIEEAN